ncbi:hypothetical protein HDU91_004547 [Kappamyces sp. JEL0680]|nr:hypothetical protein HDU91_004547 [Kappamyces sp. JEL0680]
MSDFYGILQITPDATAEEIKKGFRKQALKYHPDKAGTGEEAVIAYEKVQKAYQVLSDPNQKRIYDKYGEAGLQTFSQMGPFATFLDPATLPALNWLFFSLSVMVALLILFPALLSAKVDSNFSTFSIAFTPLFILDGVVVMFLFASLFQSVEADSEEDQASRLQFRLFKLLALLYFLLLVLFQVLLALYLDSVVSISFWVVLIPLFVWECFNFVIILIPTLAQLKEPVFVGNSEQPGRPLFFGEKLRIIAINYSVYSFRLVQIILIAYKITSGTSASWAVIFIPLWVLGAVQLSIHSFGLFSRPEASAPKGANVVQLVFFVSWASLFYSFAILLVRRLDSGSMPYVSTIMIPVFVFLGIVLLCFSCCLPCALKAQKEVIDEEMANAAQASNLQSDIDDPSQGITIVIPPRRIAPAPASDAVQPNPRRGCTVQ